MAANPAALQLKIHSLGALSGLEAQMQATYATKTS